MIQAAGETRNGTRRVLLIGLEHENILRLLRGEPIRMTPEKDPALKAIALDLEVVLCVGTLWICRRVADYGPGKLPAAAAFTVCTTCGERIAYNPAHTVDAAKVCMQCAGIRPEPMP